MGTTSRTHTRSFTPSLISPREYDDSFVRIEAVSKNDKGDLGTGLKGKLIMLDLLNPNVRVSVRDAESAAAVYRDAGIAYE